ncbi:MAG: YlbF family regulator [Anaerolineaceae bacterium]|nr:YlbF family regulator [Anaerolineaceae bacterium]
MTTLSPELQQAAQEFGRALRDHDAVQQYLQAVANLTADAAASQLDEQFESVRAALVARQRAGEDLPIDEVQAFYALREKVVGNAQIEHRDHALTMAKGYLANVGADLNRAAGLDFITMALS